MKRAPDGPKDWRPRERRIERDLARLRKAIPWTMTCAGQGVTVFGIGEKPELARQVHLVRFSDAEHDAVIVRMDGTFVLGKRLKKALAGEMPGFEHLKGAWAPTRAPGAP